MMNKQNIDCFSSMCALTTMEGGNFLDRWKKYCWVGKQQSKNHIYLFKTKVLKIFFIKLSKIGIFLVKY